MDSGYPYATRLARAELQSTLSDLKAANQARAACIRYDPLSPESPTDRDDAPWVASLLEARLAIDSIQSSLEALGMTASLPPTQEAEKLNRVSNAVPAYRLIHR